MLLTSIAPAFGLNYAPGYIGFLSHSDSILSTGIAYFTRFDRLSDIPVSHCFIVSGQDECVEALARGVITASLQERFADPHTHVFFRKPVAYTEDLGRCIARAAAKQVGRPYDYRLVVGQAIVNLWVARRFLSKQTRLQFESWFLPKCDHPAEWICSELAAHSLDAQPQLHDLGCLALPDCIVTPQRLFEDPFIFQPWHFDLPCSSLVPNFCANSSSSSSFP